MNMVKLKMKLEEALDFAYQCEKGLTLHEGWREVIVLLADEVHQRYGIGGELIAARRERDELAEHLTLATEYLQRIVDCPIGNGQIKDFRTLAAGRELLAGSALDQLHAMKPKPELADT